MIRCKSRIVKTFKTKKADCVWPTYMPGGVEAENPRAADFSQICGGEVTVKVQVVEEPYYGGHSGVLEVSTECSRCKAPYFPGIFDLQCRPEEALTELLEKSLAE